MNMKDSAEFRRKRRLNGQSIVEMAMMAPILLILISGIVEMAFMFTHYLAVSDAARNAGRAASDGNYDSEDTWANPNCTGVNKTQDFFRATACLTLAELSNERPTISVCLPDMPGTPPADEHCNRAWEDMDDIIISVFSVTREMNYTNAPPDPASRAEWIIKRFPGSGVMGWSYAVDQTGSGGAGGDQFAARTGVTHSSHFTTDQVRNLLDPLRINGGFVLVEVNYHYHQVLALPWFTTFVHDPVLLQMYAIWPQSSSEPTST